MANRYMKRCSKSLFFGEIQAKATMRYHLSPVRMTVVKKTRDNKSGRTWRNGNLVLSWWDYKLAQPLWKTGQRFLKKIKIGLYNTHII